LVTATLVLARCAGFVFRAPGFSHPAVPAVLRAGFAVLLAAAIAPAITVRTTIADSVAWALCAVTEFLIGSATGMTASLIYDAAYAGGRLVDDYVGVKAIAPSLQLVAPSGFGRVWSLALTAVFFLSGAYRLVLSGFAESFVRIPPGASPAAIDWRAFAAFFGSIFWQYALGIAAPALALAFTVQIAVGAISRVVPRFGSFTLAFPLAFAAALIACVVAVPLVMRAAPAPIVLLPQIAP
jgi:flagellar biosynthesis protein FliR